MDRACFLVCVVLVQLLTLPRFTLQQRSTPGFVFESDENFFYKIVFAQDDGRTFYEAEEICSEFENGHLASITSQAENEWLHHKIQSLNHASGAASFWVGASDRRHYGSFEWIDGKPFIFYSAFYLDARRPDKKQDYEMCLSLVSSRKDVQWVNEDCYQARGYICKTEGVPKRLSERRRFGYELEDNIWTYKFIINQDDMLSWPEADVYCRKTEWGNLLSITQPEDNRKILRMSQMLRYYFGFEKLWIGSNDIVRESQFVWSDGQRFNYTNWVPGEPTGIHNGYQEDCVAVDSLAGQWSDEYCLNAYPFICKIKMCGERTDLAFAIDASGSMGSEGFAKAKRFVKALIASFKVSNKGTHVGLIRFSTRANVIFDFNQHFSHDTVNEAIDNVIFTEGGTKTELALELARTRLYSKNGGSRESRGIFKLFVLLTDGQSENPVRVAKEADMLKKMGVHVIAVGIGKNTNQRELRSIATSESDVIGVVSFRELMIRMNEIKDKLCEAARENERKAKLASTAAPKRRRTRRTIAQILSGQH